jgi:hypothetical protein
MIAAEREAVIAMRDRNEISDTVMRKLFGELDHEQAGKTIDARSAIDPGSELAASRETDRSSRYENMFIH